MQISQQAYLLAHAVGATIINSQVEDLRRPGDALELNAGLFDVDQIGDKWVQYSNTLHRPC